MQKFFKKGVEKRFFLYYGSVYIDGTCDDGIREDTDFCKTLLPHQVIFHTSGNPKIYFDGRTMSLLISPKSSGEWAKSSQIVHHFIQVMLEPEIYVEKYQDGYFKKLALKMLNASLENLTQGPSQRGRPEDWPEIKEKAGICIDMEGARFMGLLIESG